MDITQLILDDHHEQRRLFAILEQVEPVRHADPAGGLGPAGRFPRAARRGGRGDLLPGAAEGRRPLRRAGRAEDETLDAIHDHNDIRDAVVSVPGHPVGSDEWFAGVAAANLANSDHMAEEEREGLTDFRRLAGLQLRHDLGVAWVRYEAEHYAGVPPVDKDPAGYVREEEQRQGVAGDPPGGRTPDGAAAGSSADGSLSIGSLRTP